jgi:hypothetical protein
MKLKLISSTLALALLGAGLATSAVACGGASSTEASGSVSAAVSTIGPDGATYALPTGTTLSLVNTSSGSTTFSLAVDSGGSSATFTLPAGTYSATLSTVTSLNRTGDAGPVTAVPATLSDAQPYQIVVTAGSTTSLTFHFAIAGTGQNLTFSTGGVSTNVVVSANGGTASGVGATFQVALQAGGSSATIAGYNTGAMQGTLTVTVSGAFVPTVDQVCAPVGALVLANVIDNGEGYNILESSSSTGYICFSLRSPGDTGANVLPFPFGGVSSWEGNVALLLTNSTTNSDQYLISGWTAAPVFNGSSLQLANIAAATSFTAYSSLYWYGEGTGSVSGPATLQLLP